MDKKDNKTRYWLDTQLKLFRLKFILIEILIVVLLLVFWETISYKLGSILEYPWQEVLCFLLIAGVLSSINEYFHSRKGSELEMKDNIATIRECAEQSLEYYRNILSILNNTNPNVVDVEKNDLAEAVETMPKPKRHTTEMLQDNTYEEDSKDNENEEEMPNREKAPPAVIETPLQNAQFDAITDDPINFYPIKYLSEQNSSRNIIENLSAKRAIIKYYMQCAKCIMQYEDYSITRSECRHKEVEINGHTVDIAIQISTTNGISYLITIAFTVKEE